MIPPADSKSPFHVLRSFVSSGCFTDTCESGDMAGICETGEEVKTSEKILDPAVKKRDVFAWHTNKMHD